MRKRLLLLVGIGMAAGYGCSSEVSSTPDVKWFDEATGEEYFCYGDEVGCGAGQCVKIGNDNCGACGVKVSVGSVCKVSRDASTGKPVGLSLCEATNEECPAKVECANGVCKATQACTQDGCISLSSNPKHCGEVNHACLGNEVCDDGECASTCSNGLENCDGQCTDLMNNVNSCGGCQIKCPGPDGSNHIYRNYCQEGACYFVCEAGYYDKDGDPANGCEEKVSYECGNGVVEIGESCDGIHLDDQSCETQVGSGSTGILTCRSDCLGFDTSSCSAPTTCGNGKLDGAEVCDGADLGGQTCAVVGEGSVGYLGCNANCTGFDTTYCSAPTTCGNGSVDSGEACDGTLLNNATCESVVGLGSTGTLKCSDNCYDFDRSGCTAASVCGNNILEAGEDCDGGNFGGNTCETLVGAGSKGTLLCNGCKISTENCSAPSTCGNNLIDGFDKCDGTALNGATCESIVGPGSRGTIACRDNCSDFDISGCTASSNCGNGIVEEGEVCDGAHLNDRTCATEVGFGSTGTLVCNSTCTGFVTSGCSASTTCGNGIVEAGEICDRNDIGKASCNSEVGAGSTGNVTCGADCKTLNLSGCSAATQCGNGKLDAGEVCEGTNFNGATCESVVGKGSTGNLSCGDGCKHFDISNCSKSEFCGNGTIEDDLNEVCDGTNLAGRTCADVVGYGSQGILKCQSNCLGFDTEKCTKEVKCGNGKLDPGEVCDGEMLNGATCSALVGYKSTGDIKCNDKCSDYDISGCSEPQLCGNGVLDEGEICDGVLGSMPTCADIVGAGSKGDVRCNDSCNGYVTKDCSAPNPCGNGIIDKGELCDTNNMNGATCESVVGVGSTGKLKCDSTCNFNTTDCSASRGCGNGTLEDNEVCDGSAFKDNMKSCKAYAPSIYASGSLKCAGNCQIDTSDCVPFCGNNVIDTQVDGIYIGEKCDTNMFPTDQNSCAKVVGPGSEGSLTCSDDCSTINKDQCTAAAVCGDGKLNQSSEKCDGASFALGTDECTAYSSSYASGKVKCLSNCTVDTSACIEKPRCGDGRVDEALGEECDMAKFLLDEERCSEWMPSAYSSGKVTCNAATCKVDYSACVAIPQPTCGDGHVDSDEMCDGTKFDADIASGNCVDWDSEYVGGKLKCTKDCMIDTSACTVAPRCGDGKIDPGEECDGSAFTNKYCVNYSSEFKSGTLSCTKDCKIDTNACVKYCGDGVVSKTGEECDPNTNSGAADNPKFSTSKNTCAKVMGAGYDGKLACTSDCRIVTTDCKLTEYCGDGIVNGSEFCDKTSFRDGKKACKDWNSNYESGDMSCNADCTFNESNCKAPVVPECGDGIVNQSSEECDGTQFAKSSKNCADWDDSYMSGTVTCNKTTCKVNFGACVLKPVTKCGNGVLDDDVEEWCDGDKFVSKECSDWSNAFSKGTLKCTADCEIDTSGCTVKSCGDGVLSADEFCDGTKFQDGWDKCSELSSAYNDVTKPKCKSDCTVDDSPCTKKCGNNVLDANEECDGSKFDPSMATCDDWIPGATGSLSCTATCEVDYSACKARPGAYCGDGIQNTASEECDGDDFKFGVKTCAGYSDTYASGNLKCTKDCEIDESACVKKVTTSCGDGIVNGEEICDGTEFLNNIKTCAEYSSETYTSGNLKCTSSCKIDTSSCVARSICGNGRLEADEVCDGKLFAGNKTSCTDYGDFISGEVTCSASCGIVTADCVRPETASCGDGKINQLSEECDKTAFISGSTKCSDYSGEYVSGTLSCSNSCRVDTSKCVKAPTSKCGNNVREGDEWCDGTQFLAGFSRCQDVSTAFIGGTLKCNSSCDFDTSECIRESACEPETTRCSGSSLQMCDSDKSWYQMSLCGSGADAANPVCWADGTDGDCVDGTVATIVPGWCTFHWLTPAEHQAYGRILLPSGKNENDVLAYMACTTDLSKTITKKDGSLNWNIVEAVHDPTCPNWDCGQNKQFITGKDYLGESGTNYCTFIFDFGDKNNMFACRPVQTGTSVPIQIFPGQTKLSADLTRPFVSTACVDGSARCVGNSIEVCDKGVWLEYETCSGKTPICDADSADCISNAISYDNMETMTGWYSTNQMSYTTSHPAVTYADGSRIAVTGAFYVSQHIIDGVTAVLNSNNSNNGVTISDLPTGIGMVSFKYATWGSSDSSKLQISDGTTTQTLTISTSDLSAQTKQFVFDNPKAKTVTIKPVSKSSNGRLLIDDIRWTSAK